MTYPEQDPPLGRFRRFCLAMAMALARLLPATCSLPKAASWNPATWPVMMAEARAEVATRSVPLRRASATTKSSVIYLGEALRIRRERRLGAGVFGPDAERSNVVYMSRGSRPHQRV